jgi:C-terminal processing protease CtpA/Prc
MPASDNSAAPFTPSEARTITANIVRLLDTKCIHLDGRDPAWQRLFAQRSQDLENSKSAVDFERTVNELLTHGGLSHVAFFHESGNRAPARYAINATFARLESGNGVGPRWMFQDVHEGGPAYSAGVRPADILVTVNGEVVTPPTLPTFALGTDATVSVRRVGELKDTPLTIVLPKAPANGKANAKPPMAEPTSVTARLLDEEIGYLRIAFFPGVNGQRFARDLDAALAVVAGCTRLVVDLRGNLGGFVGSLRLMSHLTPERLPIGYSLTRKGEDRGWKPDQLACIDRLPTSKFDTLKMAFRFLVWNRDRSIRLMTEGLGSKPFHGKVAVLINEHTLSAGEMVAAFIAENQLATLVGMRTGGQVLGGGNFSVGHGFILRLPAAAWYTWRGAIVEGVGVRPDLEVPFSPAALQEGRDTQLEAALATVRAK